MTVKLSKEEAMVAQAIISYIEKNKVYSDFSFSAKWVADGLNNRIDGGKYSGTKERFDYAEMNKLGLETKLEQDKDSVSDEQGKKINDDFDRLEAQYKSERGLMNIFRSIQTYLETGEVLKVA
tara:strand:+ start:1550 stop:1918 length:369 start_codon:yes stop_codon:yes gene_type:complete